MCVLECDVNWMSIWIVWNCCYFGYHMIEALKLWVRGWMKEPLRKAFLLLMFKAGSYVACIDDVESYIGFSEALRVGMLALRCSN